MKTIIKSAILVSSFFLIGFGSTAQWNRNARPLRGSGKIIEKSFDFRDFDKLDLRDLDGRVIVEVGKPFSINISADDNIMPFVKVELKADAHKAGKLLVYFENNKNNRLYVEDTQLTVRISMPEASVVEHTGNDDLTVNGIVGRYFRLENYGNGDARLSGSTDDLDIVKDGNGDVKAERVAARKAKVKSMGNGNVIINVSESFVGTGSGNGNIENKGKGSKSWSSTIAGNGRVLSEQ